MKKALLFLSAFAAVILLSAAFAGCGDNKKDDVWIKKEGLISIGFSQVGAESDWRLANTKSMRETFSEDKYNFKIKDAQQKPKNQFAAVRWFIAQKADYIVIAPTVETGWDEVLGEAQAAGIPVIIVDRMIKVKDDSLYTCWVGSDFLQEGKTAVEWMETKFAGKTDLKIVHLQGSMGSSAQIGRTDGLEEGAAKNGWTIVHQKTGEFTEVKGKEIMEQYLASNPAFDVLYCENDNMAFGAITAMKAKGSPYTYGRNGAIAVISFDATNAGLKATLAGDINYNVECNPLHGPRVEEIIKQLMEGKTPDKKQFVKEAAFDTDDITQEDINARAY